MTIEDFLAWEARQDIKYEFDGYEPVALAGGSVNHSTIQTNMAIAIGGRLRGSRCAFHGSDLKLVSARRSRYPDGQVVCGPQDGSATFTTMPTVLFEIVSSDDAARDHVEKASEYMALMSVQQYVILEQDRVAATVHARVADGWCATVLLAGTMLRLPEIGLEVPLDELYEGVDPA